MPDDILTLPLTDAPSAPLATDAAITLDPLDSDDTEALAAAYLAAYPPGIAAADLAEARAEMDASFSGEYGALRADASASAWHDGDLIGAIMVVARSIWDEDLEGPFIIDLFVSPAARGLGAGRALVAQAVRACQQAGDTAISLRFGEGTSDPAMRIYRELGFAAPTAG